VSAPLSRGILATSFVELPADMTAESVTALYADAYAHEPFVRFVRDRTPEVAAVGGQQLRGGRLHAGRAGRRHGPTDIHAGDRQRDRQPDQGRRRASRSRA
jgi:N-acetyl-gamma-glutamyl-phosphate reductase